MLKTLIAALVSGFATANVVQAQGSAPQELGPVVQHIAISAPGVLGNGLASCRLSGQIALWVSRPVELRDEMRENLGTIEAGLAQFTVGSRLEQCAPDRGVDLSEQFANFLIADERLLKSGALGRSHSAVVASQLAQDFFHLAEPGGADIPLAGGIRANAVGSVSYRFVIVLIRSAETGAFDAVIHRETTSTKFAPQLSASDRHSSRLKWSSVR